jgi:hypothetical protein
MGLVAIRAGRGRQRAGRIDLRGTARDERGGNKKTPPKRGFYRVDQYPRICEIRPVAVEISR